MATEVALNEPNGLWVRSDGTVFILDTANGKVRRLDTNGMIQTLFTVPGGISVGRGIWVSDDETLAYFCSGTIVKKWTVTGGVVNLSIGYFSLGNLVVDPAGDGQRRPRHATLGSSRRRARRRNFARRDVRVVEGARLEIV